MNEVTKKDEKKAEPIEQEPKAVELSDKDLDNVAGGSSDPAAGLSGSVSSYGVGKRATPPPPKPGVASQG